METNQTPTQAATPTRNPNDWTADTAEEVSELITEIDGIFDELMDRMGVLKRRMSDRNAEAYFFNHLSALHDVSGWGRGTDWQEIKRRAEKRIRKAEGDQPATEDDEDED